MKPSDTQATPTLRQPIDSLPTYIVTAWRSCYASEGTDLEEARVTIHREAALPSALAVAVHNDERLNAQSRVFLTHIDHEITALRPTLAGVGRHRPSLDFLPGRSKGQAQSALAMTMDFSLGSLTKPPVWPLDA